MDFSDVYNSDVRVKVELDDVSPIKNEDYKIIDNACDAKNDEFLSFCREYLIYGLRENDKNSGPNNDLEIEFECKDEKLGINLLVVKKIEDDYPDQWQPKKNSCDYQTQKKIKEKIFDEVIMDTTGDGETNITISDMNASLIAIKKSEEKKNNNLLFLKHQIRAAEHRLLQHKEKQQMLDLQHKLELLLLKEKDLAKKEAQQQPNLQQQHNLQQQFKLLQKEKKSLKSNSSSSVKIRIIIIISSTNSSSTTTTTTTSNGFNCNATRTQGEQGTRELREIVGAGGLPIVDNNIAQGRPDGKNINFFSIYQLSF
ncbi:hypothetical protein TKK_0014670 [Trichogramma kaykai]